MTTRKSSALDTPCGRQIPCVCKSRACFFVIFYVALPEKLPRAS